MILKHRKGAAIIFYGMVLALFVSLLTFSKRQFIISMHDTFEGIMSMSPGFSSPRNLADPGDGHIFEQSISQKITAMTQAIPQVAAYKFLNRPEAPQFERLDLDVKFIDFKAILDDRERALKAGILSNPVSVKADIRFRGQTYKAKIRLKGDLGSHWTSRHRMSFRVNIRRGKTILGFKKFSLQKPSSRAHPYDQTFQEMMRKVGNLSSVHKYVRVFVNGSDWGIMNMEEHISKVFLERLKRKESANIRFQDERLWEYKRKVANPYPAYRLSNPVLNVNLYGANKYLNEPIFRKRLTYISEQRLKKNHPHLFDIESFTKAIVVARAWNHKHTLGYHNSRYYLNPYTLRLEPITTDQLPYQTLSDDPQTPSHEMYKLHLQVMATDAYKNNLRKTVAEVSQTVLETQDTLDAYQKLFPLDKPKNGQIVVDNMKKIMADPEKYLLIRGVDPGKNGAKPPMPTDEQAQGFDVHLYVRHYEDGRLQFFNLLPDAVRVNRVLANNESIFEAGLYVPGYEGDLYEPVTLKTDRKGIRDGQFTVETEYKGNIRTAVNGVTLMVNEMQNPLLAETPEDLPFLEKTQNENWEIPQGEWRVDGPLTIHGDLKIRSGTHLEFSEGSYLIIKGSLIAEATEENPIIFDSANTWKGIYVLEGGEMSRLLNVVFKNTSALKDGLIDLTGAVTFYNTEVDLKNVRFEGTQAEDALNLVKTSFTLKNVEVSNTVSDGIDFDFSKGIVRESKFFDIGGDALDFSGSPVEIHQVVARRVKDKAVSVGEASSVIIRESDFSDVGVGIASKDGSHTEAEKVSISKYGLHAAMTYIKKDFYGTPSLKLVNCEVDPGDTYSRQVGTLMLVDGVEIEEVQTDVKVLYKDGVMKK